MIHGPVSVEVRPRPWERLKNNFRFFAPLTVPCPCGAERTVKKSFLSRSVAREGPHG